MNTAIILAGGVGLRAGGGRPKQFVEILGKPVLAYTADIFQENSRIDAIEIVCHPSWMDYCQGMIEKYRLSKVRWLVSGGETFQDSVINGISHLETQPQVRKTDYVLIQYGGAPFTSQKIVNAVIDMTLEKGSAVTATPCYQLLGMKDKETESRTWVDRDRYIQIACPYGFQFGYLLDIYKRAQQKGLLQTIEPHTTSLMYALGDSIYLAYGDQTNIKITTREDLDLFEGYVLKKQRDTEISLAD